MRLTKLKVRIMWCIVTVIAVQRKMILKLCLRVELRPHDLPDADPKIGIGNTEKKKGKIGKQMMLKRVSLLRFRIGKSYGQREGKPGQGQ